MSRFAAVACLLAMCASWLPHSHSETHSGLHAKPAFEAHSDDHATDQATDRATDRATDHATAHSPVRSVRSAMHSVGCPHDSMASDDAHEEHSSRAAIENGPCLSCRSKEDRQGDRVRSVVPTLGSARTASYSPERRARLPEDLALGLHPPRAPPIG
jgi:hypothetical protein